MVRSFGSLVSPVLGHKSSAITLDSYADLFVDDLGSIADRLNERVLAESGGSLWKNDLLAFISPQNRLRGADLGLHLLVSKIHARGLPLREETFGKEGEAGLRSRTNTSRGD